MSDPVFDAPQSPIEAILQNMLGANNVLREPQSRNEALLLQILDAMQHGGGDVTAQAVLAAILDMTEVQATAALAALGGISTDQLGTVFTFKGSKATYADLLLVENPQIGDVWFVDADSANYVWIEDEANPNGFWDEFGQPIDLSSYALKPIVTTVSGSTPTIAAEDKHIYECSECSSLTVSSFPASGWFEIDFESGSTATVLFLPNDLDDRMPRGFTVETNTHYEINVKNGWPMVGSCPIPTAT